MSLIIITHMEPLPS
jgi:hypothetical protein